MMQVHEQEHDPCDTQKHGWLFPNGYSRLCNRRTCISSSQKMQPYDWQAVKVPYDSFNVVVWCNWTNMKSMYAMYNYCDYYLLTYLYVNGLGMCVQRSLIASILLRQVERCTEGAWVLGYKQDVDSEVLAVKKAMECKHGRYNWLCWVDQEHMHEHCFKNHPDWWAHFRRWHRS